MENLSINWYNNELKVLLTLKKLNKAGREQLAISTLQTKEELDIVLRKLEREKKIKIINSEPDNFEVDELATIELEEYSKVFQNYRLEIIELLKLEHSSFLAPINGSLIVFNLYDSNEEIISTYNRFLDYTTLSSIFNFNNTLDEEKSWNILHWANIRNLKQFLFGESEDFQLRASNRFNTPDFEENLEGVYKEKTSVYLFGKLSPEIITEFCRQKDEQKKPEEVFT